MNVIRWQETQPPQEQELRRRMQQEGLSPYAQLIWLPAIVWFCPPEYAIARKLGRREFFVWRRRDCDILKLRMVNISPSFNVEVSRRGGSGVGWSGGPCGRLWSGADRAGNDGRPQGPQPRIHATPAPTRYPDHVVRLMRLGRDNES